MVQQAKWLDIGPITQIEPGMAATLPVEGGDEIAVFHTMRGEFYALVNKCPHKAGPLSQGIVHGDSVTCPLHNWRISLRSGQALGDDEGCVPTIPVKVDAGRIYLLRGLGHHRLAQQVDPPGVDLDRDRRHAALIVAERFAAPERDAPVVQRASHAVAVDDALAERPGLVRALVDQCVELAAHGVEHGDLLAPLDR